jgi:DNA polymerase-4
MPTATAATRTILAVARALLATAMPTIGRRGVTLLGVTVANLERHGAGVQLELPVDRAGGALDTALDELRHRFGPGSVTRAALLEQRDGLVPWLFPGDGEGPEPV